MKPSSEDILLSKNSAKTLLFRNAVDTTTLKKEARMIQKERNLEEKLFLKQREHMMQRQSSLAGELSPRSRRKEIDTNIKQMLSASSLPQLPPEQSSPPRTRVTVSNSKTFSGYDHRRPVSSNVMKATSLLSSSFSTSLPEQSSPHLSRVRVSRSKTFSASDRRPVTHGSKSATVSPQSSSLSMMMSDQQLTLPHRAESKSKMFTESVNKLSNNSLTVSLPNINVTTPVTVKPSSKNNETKLQWKWRESGADTCEEEIYAAIDDWEDLRKCRYLRTLTDK